MAKQKKPRPKTERVGDTALWFSANHLWARVDSDRAYIGLTDFGQRDLGKIIAAELPDVGEEIEVGEPFGELESTRTVQELLAPVSGTVTAVNTEIEGNTSLINEDPYHDGWLIEVELSEEEPSDLMGADEYDDFVAEDGES